MVTFVTKGKVVLPTELKMVAAYFAESKYAPLDIDEDGST